MQKTILFLALAAFAASCSKTPASCTFATATFSGNTYKITKFTQGGVDFTTPMLAGNKCFSNTFKLNADGTVTETKASGCSSNIFGTKWRVSVSGGKNRFVDDAAKDSSIVSSFDCNSFIVDADYGVGIASATYTKQ